MDKNVEDRLDFAIQTYKGVENEYFLFVSHYNKSSRKLSHDLN
jgi:hypothetical protein